MSRFIVSGALGAAALLALSQHATAHVSFETAEVPAAATFRAKLLVPHGCDGRATNTLRVVVPHGVVNVQPFAKPGWQVEVERGAYERPVRVGDRTVTEGVRAIRWSGGELPNALVDGFAFRARLADGVEGPFHFPAVQGCGTAEAAWTEIPAAGQDPHALRRPAPALRLAQASGAPAQPSARTYRVGALVIEAPWARATPQGARVGGGYMRITNTGNEADRLTGGTAVVAGRFEIHEMSVTDGVMRMRPLAQGLEIAPGQTVELRPGGYHIMFMELREGLREGGTVRGTLVFQRAGTVEVEYRVGPIGGGAPAGGGHSHH